MLLRGYAAASSTLAGSWQVVQMEVNEGYMAEARSSTASMKSLRQPKYKERQADYNVLPVRYSTQQMGSHILHELKFLNSCKAISHVKHRSQKCGCKTNRD